MRIIAGSAKGRPVLAPKSMQTRPTLDRVKEALFGILQFRVPNARVLDLFAGSGNLGLEALSRGARYAVLNDMDRNCCAVIRKNLEAFGFVPRADVLQLSAMQALARLSGGEPFDLVFLDPPYQKGAQAELQELFARGLVAHGGTVVVEFALGAPPTAVSGLMRQCDTRKYGDTLLAFFQAEEGAT